MTIPTWVILTPLAVVGLHLAARYWSRVRAERQAAERVAAYVASLTPEAVAELLSGPHWRQP